MMMYRDLLIQFKADLSSVIDDYEQILEDEQAEPSSRAVYLLMLRDAIDSFPEYSEALLPPSISDIVKDFRTGLQTQIFDLWIETDKSRLTDALEVALSDPQYSNESFLQAQIRDSQQELMKSKNVKASVSDINTDTVLKFKKVVEEV